MFKTIRRIWDWNNRASKRWNDNLDRKLDIVSQRIPRLSKRHIHEWLADHIKWVQYPDVRQVKPKEDWHPHPRNRFIEIDHNSDSARIDGASAILLLVFSLVIGAIGLCGIAVGLFVLYVIASSLF